MTRSPRAPALALVGHAVAGSLSPRLHAAALAARGLGGSYRLIEAASEADLAAALDDLRRGRWLGLNVTAPYKRNAARRCDRWLSRAARAAANTLAVADGALVGASSDGPGLRAGLAARGVPWRPGLALAVVGAGGAARAIVADWSDAGGEVAWVAARSLAAAQEVAQLHAGTTPRRLEDGPGAAVDVLVHASALGHAAGVPAPSPPGWLGPAWWRCARWHVDVVVRSGGPSWWQTWALAAGLGAAADGAPGVVLRSGEAMLVGQAALAFALWCGGEPPFAAMAAAIGLDWRPGDAGAGVSVAAAAHQE